MKSQDVLCIRQNHFISMDISFFGRNHEAIVRKIFIFAKSRLDNESFNAYTFPNSEAWCRDGAAQIRISRKDPPSEESIF
jgi:hypothetical protein